IAGALIDHAAHSVTENESTVERARKKISDRTLNLEAPRSAKKAVVREAPFDLKEIDRFEAAADTSLAQLCFSDVDDQNFRRISLPRNVDRRALEEIGFVQRALAAKQIGSPEYCAGMQAHRFE